MNEKELEKLDRFDNIVSAIVGFALVGFFVLLWILSEVS